MADETVKVYVVDQNSDPLVGVLVRFFDSTGATFITQDYTTLVSGEAVAEVTLPGGTTPVVYTIRMSLTGVAFDGSLGNQGKSPQTISVYSPASGSPSGTNNFQVMGETFDQPAATDPRLCRCSGFFKDITGRALVNLEMKLVNEFAPAVVEGYGVMGEGVDIQTDNDGYVVVDLYRYGKYLAWVQGVQAPDGNTEGAIGFPRYMQIPNASYANLPDLLFPVVNEIVFTPATITLAVGETVQLTTVVTASDGRTLVGTAVEDVTYSSEDTAVAGVSADIANVNVVGITAGTTNLLAVRKDSTIVKIPNTGIIGQPVVITVT